MKDNFPKYFLDSNIAIYALFEEVEDDPKKDIAFSLLTPGACISTQVLLEIGNYMTRKLGAPSSEFDIVFDNLERRCAIYALGFDHIRYALNLHETYSLSYRDSYIVAVAYMSGCTTLYSEDMQHGLNIDHLTIVNPFLT